MYKLLDYFFTIFHTLVVLFNITGWIFKETRKIHLIVIILTTISWFGLGIFYGIGYCPLTDWHFNVLENLGYDLPDSYIEFLIERIFSVQVKSKLVDIITMSVFIMIMAATVYFNYVDMKKRKINRN